MRTTIKKLTYLVSACCIFCACNNDLEESNYQINSSKETEISFIYDGQLYMSQCIETKDSTIILDKSTKQITDKLSKLPRLTTIVSPDPEKPIMYFDTPEDADKHFNWIDDTSSNNITTKAVRLDNLIVNLYEDKNKGGWVINRQIPFNNTIEEIALGGKNEKISSLQLMLIGSSDYPNETSAIVGAVKLFEDKSFGGSSIYFYATIGNFINYVSNLKNYPLYPGSKRNWGDRTCSFKAGFINYKDLPNW